MNLVLIGVMGCGKTTVGRMLARRLKLVFVDMDTEIEKRHGPITEIFAGHGEDHFRDIETAMTEELSGRDRLVISTGGGIVKRPGNVTNLKKNGIVVFLDRPASVILKKLDVSRRPLLRDNPQKLHQILEERYPLYTAQCDYRIDASGSLQKTLSRIIPLWNKHR